MKKSIPAWAAAFIRFDRKVRRGVDWAAYNIPLFWLMMGIAALFTLLIWLLP